MCLFDIGYWYIICRVEVINDLENRFSHFGTNMAINNGGIMMWCDDVREVSCKRDMHSCAFSVSLLPNSLDVTSENWNLQIRNATWTW